MSAGAPKSRVTEELGARETDDAFRLLVEQVADYAIFLLDSRGRISSWNAGAQRIKGYAPHEILGSHFSVFFTEEDRARDKPAKLLEIATNEGRHGEEGWRVRKDGTRFWAHGVVTALRDESGRLRGFAKITHDLTERLNAEKAARQLVDERAARVQRDRAEQERRMMLRRQNELSALRADVGGMAASGCDSAALLERAAAAVVERLGVAAARIWIFDDTGLLRLQANAGVRLPEDFSPEQLRASIVGGIAETGAPASSNDLSTDPGFGSAWDPHDHIAFDGCPLMAVGHAMGVLGAFGHGALPEDTLDALRGVADVVSRSLERRRAEIEVQRSRDRLAVILATISDGVTAQGKDGRLIFANEAAARITGFDSTAEMISSNVREILSRFEILDEHGQPLPPSELPGRKALHEGQASQLVVRFRNLHTGVQRWAQVSAAPVLDEGGEVELAVNVFTDLTERKHAEEAWRFLAEASATLASSLSYESTLAVVARLAVPQVADWCAVDVVEVDGRLQRLAMAGVQPEQAPPGSTMVVPMTAGDRSVGSMTFAIGGARLPYTPQQLVLAQEIARRAGLAIDNARAYREVRAAVQMRDTFLSIASHELKTPLSSLTLLLSGLLRSARAGKLGELGPDKVVARLERIDEQADRLTALMNQLLDVSRLAAGRFALAPQKTDLRQVARDVMARFREEATQTRTRLELVESEEPVVGLWDRSRLDQVITNLITNALKYGDRSPVTVEIGGDAATARLSVTDRGPGIPEADQLRIFEQYERAASTNLGGLGLGLWLVRQLARAHGGEVSVRSRPGEGAAFTVTLPRRMGSG